MVSVPLPLSRVLNGEVQAAEAGRTQAEAQRAAAELLSAPRTWTDTYIAYETALADHAHALIALETAAGAWDLTL